MKLEIKNYEDKMEKIKEELKKEREKTGKKTAREISEVGIFKKQVNEADKLT